MDCAWLSARPCVGAIELALLCDMVDWARPACSLPKLMAAEVRMMAADSGGRPRGFKLRPFMLPVPTTPLCMGSRRGWVCEKLRPWTALALLLAVVVVAAAATAAAFIIKVGDGVGSGLLWRGNGALRGPMGACCEMSMGGGTGEGLGDVDALKDAAVGEFVRPLLRTVGGGGGADVGAPEAMAWSSVELGTMGMVMGWSSGMDIGKGVATGMADTGLPSGVVTSRTGD